MAVDTYFGSVALLLAFDGANNSTTFTDDSPSTKTLAASGDAKLTAAEKKFGTASGTFNGSNAYVTATDSADFALPGDFTIEAEVWTDPATGAWSRLLENEEFNVTGGWHINFNGSDSPGSRRIGFQVGLNGGGGSRIDSDAAFPTSQWVHFRVTRAGNTVRMFVNGTLQSATLTTTEAFTSQKLRIGANLGTAGNFMTGLVDELRITKGVARSTASFTQPAAAHSSARGGPVSAPSPLSAALVLGAHLVTALVSLPGPLGAPRVLGILVHVGRISLPSILQSPRVFAVHDFTQLVAGPSFYVMDLITPGGTVRVPISSWQATLRDAVDSYVQCVVPACEPWVDAINEATEFQITRKSATVAGVEVQSMIASAALQSIALAQGGYSYSATISGYADAAAAPETIERELVDIRTVFTYSTGYRVRCAIDWLLRPGNTATFGATSFVVRYISYYVQGNDAFMDVGE